MKETFENLRREYYTYSSSQPVHPEMKNKVRNLVDDRVDSATSTELLTSDGLQICKYD